MKTEEEKMNQSEIWHCPSEPDREIAEILVRHQTPAQWEAIAKHFSRPYPVTLADKFDLIYRMLGCKSETRAEVKMSQPDGTAPASQRL